MFTTAERRYLETARGGRLATADGDGRPHAVPVCFALVEDDLMSAMDEMPQSEDSSELRRSHNVRETPYVAVVVDCSEDWSRLG